MTSQVHDIPTDEFKLKQNVNIITSNIKNFVSLIKVEKFTCWKSYKVSLTKSSWFTSITWSNSNLTFQQVAAFVLTIGPRKFTYSTTPCTPVENSFHFKKFLSIDNRKYQPFLDNFILNKQILVFQSKANTLSGCETTSISRSLRILSSVQRLNAKDERIVNASVGSRTERSRK